jgi:hypothetical protein
LRKINTGGLAVATGVSMAVASGAFAGGNGAARAGLTVNTGSDNSECESGAGATNGFAIFNAPGRPGATIKFNGEVSLKNGAPDTAYNVYLVPDGGDCQVPAGVLATNGVGNGNAHLAKPGQGAGTYYIVLQDMSGAEQFSTGTVTIS